MFYLGGISYGRKYGNSLKILEEMNSYSHAESEYKGQ